MTESRTKDLDLHYRLLPAADVARAFDIERAEYPESEAASLENLVYRKAVAPRLFLGCYTRSRTPASTTTAPTAGGLGIKEQKEHEKTRKGQMQALDQTPLQGHQGQEREQQQQQQQKLGDDVLIGYIVSTQSSDVHLTHASMSSHDPKGASVCIHSVCVAGPYQRRGIARAMTKEYLKHLQRLNKDLVTAVTDAVSASAFTSSPSTSTLPSFGSSSEETESEIRLERVLLIAHQELIGLYAGAGFELVGKSAVEHGPDPWYEMVFHL